MKLRRNYSQKHGRIKTRIIRELRPLKTLLLETAPEPPSPHAKLKARRKGTGKLRPDISRTSAVIGSVTGDLNFRVLCH